MGTIYKTAEEIRNLQKRGTLLPGTQWVSAAQHAKDTDRLAEALDIANDTIKNLMVEIDILKAGIVQKQSNERGELES